MAVEALLRAPAAVLFPFNTEVDMMDQREATLDELLSEPIIRKVMARDRVQASDIRRLMRQAKVRRTHARTICDMGGRGCERI